MVDIGGGITGIYIQIGGNVTSRRTVGERVGRRWYDNGQPIAES